MRGATQCIHSIYRQHITSNALDMSAHPLQHFTQLLYIGFTGRVIGLERKSKLRGIKMSSPDIRAGVSLLIAALSAEGKSIIQNIDQIDRGYQYIDTRLQELGAEIKRV